MLPQWKLISPLHSPHKHHKYWNPRSSLGSPWYGRHILRSRDSIDPGKENHYWSPKWCPKKVPSTQTENGTEYLKPHWPQLAPFSLSLTEFKTSKVAANIQWPPTECKSLSSLDTISETSQSIVPQGQTLAIQHTHWHPCTVCCKSSGLRIVWISNEELDFVAQLGECRKLWIQSPTHHRHWAQ